MGCGRAHAEETRPEKHEELEATRPTLSSRAGTPLLIAKKMTIDTTIGTQAAFEAG
jgi:hypothetical protein